MALPTPPRSPSINRLSREHALELIKFAADTYVRESYDGEFDVVGLLMELKTITNIAAMMNWFIHTLGATPADTVVLLMIGLADLEEEDFDFIITEGDL